MSYTAPVSRLLVRLSTVLGTGNVNKTAKQAAAETES